MSDWLTIGLAIGTLAVVVGVLMEGAEYADEIRRHGWPKRCLKKVEIIGFAILVAGLAIEWYFQTKIGQYDTARIIELSPRNITLDQRVAIGLACNQFQGKTVKVTSTSGDPEAARLGVEIIDALSFAGIHPDSELAGYVVGGADFGIRVTGPPSESGVINCLLDALEHDGKLAVNRHPPPSFPVGGGIIIWVDMKPIDQAPAD